MVRFDRLKGLEEWVNRLLQLTFLIPSSVLTALASYFAINADYPPLAILLTAFGTFSMAVILILVVGNLRAWVGAGVILLTCVFGVGYSLYFEKQQENKTEALKKAALDEYRVDFAGWATDINFDPAAPARSNRVTTASAALTFDNNNDFPIYYKSVRRTSSFENRTSDDPQETVEGVMPSRTKDNRIGDSPVEFDPPYKAARGLRATVDFLICYGRSKGSYHKGYAAKGTLIFLARVGGGLYPPDFYRADSSPDSFGDLACK